MTDAKVTKEIHRATLRLLGPLLLSSSLKFSDRLAVTKNVEQALANEREAGRKEGLEETANWHDVEFEKCQALLARGPDRQYAEAIYAEREIHEAAAKAIRTLADKPTREL